MKLVNMVMVKLVNMHMETEAAGEGEAGKHGGNGGGAKPSNKEGTTIRKHESYPSNLTVGTKIMVTG